MLVQFPRVFADCIITFSLSTVPFPYKFCNLLSLVRFFITLLKTLLLKVLNIHKSKDNSINLPCTHPSASTITKSWPMLFRPYSHHSDYLETDSRQSYASLTTFKKITATKLKLKFYSFFI